MSCSSYGMPQPYSNYAESVPTSWYDHTGQGSTDAYNNYTNQSVQQSLQLNRNARMPASWNSASAAQAATASATGKDDWSRYSVTEEGVERYISAAGAVRFRQNDRSSSGRRLGTQNLLRSQPPAALTVAGMEPCEDRNWFFNDSSDRLALVTPVTKPWIGCGN